MRISYMIAKWIISLRKKKINTSKVINKEV